MLDSVDLGVSLIPALCSGRTVGRTVVYFIRKLLRVGCAQRGLFVGVSAKAPAFALFWPGTAVAFGYDCVDSLKHTKLYGEIEIICETRYFVYLRRLCPPLNTLILNHWSARTGLLTT